MQPCALRFIARSFGALSVFCAGIQPIVRWRFWPSTTSTFHSPHNAVGRGFRYFSRQSVLSVLRVVPSALHLISKHWPCEPVSSGYPAGHVSNSNPFHRHQCLVDSSPGCTGDLGTLGSNPPRNLCNQQKRQKPGHRLYARYTARPRYRDLAIGSTQVSCDKQTNKVARLLL